MTNFEWLKSLSIEQLAKAIDEDLFDCYDCPQHIEAADHPFLKDGHCDNNCRKYIEEWLKKEHIIYTREAK